MTATCWQWSTVLNTYSDLRLFFMSVSASHVFVPPACLFPWSLKRRVSTSGVVISWFRSRIEVLCPIAVFMCLSLCFRPLRLSNQLFWGPCWLQWSQSWQPGPYELVGGAFRWRNYLEVLISAVSMPLDTSPRWCCIAFVTSARATSICPHSFCSAWVSWRRLRGLGCGWLCHAPCSGGHSSRFQGWLVDFVDADQLAHPIFLSSATMTYTMS